MATVIDFRRPRWSAFTKPVTDERAELQFWRKSMVSVSIAMGVFIALALGVLFFGLRHGLLDHDWGMWVLVAALFSVVGLTKVIIANLVFYILLQDEAPPGKPTPPQPTPGLRMRPRHSARRAIPVRRRRTVVRRRTAEPGRGS